MTKGREEKKDTLDLSVCIIVSSLSSINLYVKGHRQKLIDRVKDVDDPVARSSGAYSGFVAG